MSIRVEKLSEDKVKSMGIRSWPIWTKEASIFDWHYDEQEQCLFLEGEVTVTAEGQNVSFGKGDFVDLSSPMKEADKLLEELEKGADVAIGSRAKRQKGVEVQQSLRRYVSGRIFNLFVQSLVLPGIQDSQCGFKCFTRDAAHKLFSAQKLDGFSFDVEVLFLARKLGLRIVEVPVMWSQGVDSKVSLLRDSTRMLGDLVRIKGLHA